MYYVKFIIRYQTVTGRYIGAITKEIMASPALRARTVPNNLSKPPLPTTTGTCLQYYLPVPAIGIVDKNPG